MAEKSLALPLSGAEIIEAICSKIAASLQRDCYLNANFAYQAFSGKINISLKLQDTGREVELEQTVEVQADPEKNPMLEGADTSESEAEIDLQPQPPNQVRKETDQPLPVLTQNENGKQEVRHVSYKRPGTFVKSDKIKENEERIRKLESELAEKP